MMSQYDDAVLTLILAIIREHYMLTGDAPTLDQLKVKIQQAGA